MGSTNINTMYTCMYFLFAVYIYVRFVWGNGSVYTRVETYVGVCTCTYTCMYVHGACCSMYMYEHVHTAL